MTDRVSVSYRVLVSLLAVKEIMSRIARRDLSAVRDRLGTDRSETKAPHTWIHAASNGEVASAKPVIEALLSRGQHLLVTTNTDSGLALVRGWALTNLSARLAPVDLLRPTRRVFETWRVTAHITFESDLWPERILSCPGPVLVLGGRLTERSARGWRRFDALSRRVMARVTYLSAQDAHSLQRFKSFGLAPQATGPVYDLKALYTPKDETPDPELAAAFPRQNTWLAASTHEGEDETVFAAHRMAQQARPDLRLILAPRHPKRANAIAALARRMGLSVGLRSNHDAPGDADVYIADTLGEMHLWYALAGITFVAGSLTDRGGHTPYEPAHFASAILHGPDTMNFRAAYQRLADADASIAITDADDLAQALIMLGNQQDQVARGQKARSTLHQATDFDTLLRDVIAVLDA